MSKHNGPGGNSLFLAQLVLFALFIVTSIARVRGTGLLSFVGLVGMYLCGLMMLGVSLYIGKLVLEFDAKRKSRRKLPDENPRLLIMAAVGFYGLSSGFLWALAILGFALGFTPNPTASAVGAVVLGAAMLLGYTAGILQFAATKQWLAALGLTLLLLAVIYTGARQLLSHFGMH
jgi:hypothetical protein